MRENLTLLFSIVSDGLENLPLLIGAISGWAGKSDDFHQYNSQMDGKI